MKPLPCSFGLPIILAALLISFSVGCDRDGVKVYHATPEEISTPPVASTIPEAAPIMAPEAIPAIAPVETSAGKPTWEIPTDWQTIDPGPMLFAKFQISSDTAKANVNISQLNRDGGGLAANVKRWRTQIGLNPLDETELSKSVTPLGTANVVDFTGTDNATGKPIRLVAAVVPQNGQTWFYKLMGDETIVAQQKDAFLKFVQTTKYNDAR